MGSCLTLRNELSEETHALTKQETLLGRGACAESSGVRKPRRTALHVAHSLEFYGDGVSFRVVSGQSACLAHIWSNSGSLLVAHTSQPRWIPTRRILGGWQDILWAGVLPPFGPPDFSQLVFDGSIMFLTRTFCRETTHANGYRGV